jgi:(p)ppGpp synthase/HD superfamily hydrolase
MSIIRQAAQMARDLHQGQKRAGGRPYIEHPMRVAGMVTMLDDEHLPATIDDNMIAAAWLHDVYEDTHLSPPLLSYRFNFTLGRYVKELTNRFTKKDYPRLNRKMRKAAETMRLADVSPQAQIIKLCDRIDNLQTINEKGDKFSLTFCAESIALAEVLTTAPVLQAQVFKLARQLQKKLEKK